jgi:hypothetical protein
MCRPEHERGPQVPQHEDLFRIVSAEHIKEGRISSGAFNYSPCFSVDVASRTESPEASLSRVPRACAVIKFNCGAAREIGGLDTRDEPEEENAAHAHVYTNPGNSKRKTLAKKLVTECQLEVIINHCDPATSAAGG